MWTLATIVYVKEWHPSEWVAQNEHPRKEENSFNALLLFFSWLGNHLVVDGTSS